MEYGGTTGQRRYRCSGLSCERLFFARRAAEVQPRRYAILGGFGTFADSQGKVPELPDHTDSLLESFFGEFFAVDAFYK